ncbi:MAG: hypothetical protein HKN33_18500 [Pyrinomonadaceae bacterium]|nr:hypothetical protein [Pyrinomonadaceae bacterium]
MKAIFERTSEKQYAIHAVRPGFPDATMDPAPGFDPLLPHDVMHLVVEASLGLDDGVFGQLAKGGLAGTFRIRPDGSLSKREMTRLRRRSDSVDEKLLRKGRRDSERSERATYICWYEWLKRSQSAARRKSAKEMSANAAHIRATAPTDEIAALDLETLEKICSRLDVLSACWSGKGVGEKMTIAWPDVKILQE